MPIKSKPIDLLICLLIESLLVFMVLVPFSGGSNPWLFIKPFSVLLAIAVVLFLIFQYIFKWDNFVLYFLIAVVVFGVGIVLGLSIIFSMITAMFLLWRVTDALNGNTLSHLWMIYVVIVGVTFLYIILVGLLDSGFPHLSRYIIFFFTETFLTVLSHFFQVQRLGKFGTKMSASYSMTFGGIIVIALIFAGVGPYISKALRFILEWLGIIIFFVVQALLSFFHKNSDLDKIWKNITKGRDETHKQTDQLAHLSKYHTPESFTIIGIIVAIIVGLIVFFYLKKKWHRDGHRKRRLNLHQQAFTGEMNNSIVYGGKKRKVKPPKDPVRLALFQLQKKLFKQTEGRIGFETLGEWLGRLPGTDQQASIIRTIYEKVRYGKKTIQPEELKAYQQAVTTVKDQIYDSEKQKTNLWEKEGKKKDPYKWEKPFQ